VAARSLLTRSHTPRWLIGVGRRRGGPPQAVQEALFEVELRPERRYFRQILQALAGAMLGGDPLRAEAAVSRVLGVIWASDPNRDGAAEEAFGRGLVEFARQRAEPAAVNLLRVLAATATVREVREAAAEALAVRAALFPDFDPPVGAVSIGRCWLVEDAFGDHATVVCEFGYGAILRASPRHGLAVQIDQVAHGAAVDITLVEDVDAAELDLRYGAEHASDEFRRVDPGVAGAMLERSLAHTDLMATTTVAPGFAPLRALALARVRALPSALMPLTSEHEPSAAQCDAVVSEFLRSSEAQSLTLPLSLASLAGPAAPPTAPAARRVADLLVEFAADHDRSDLVRVSPGRVEAFLFDWLPGRPAERELGVGVVAAVVRAWSAWASRQAGMPLMTRDSLARAVDELLDAYLRLCGDSEG